MPASTKPAKKKKRKRSSISRANIRMRMKALYPRKGDTTFSGTQGPNLILSTPRSYANEERVKQFLQHFAGVLKTYYNAQKGHSEVEVQIASINDERLLISANDDGTTQFFMNQITAEAKAQEAASTESEGLKDYLEQIATEALTTSVTSKRFISTHFERHTSKFIQVLKKNRTFAKLEDISNLLDAAALDCCIQIDALQGNATEIRRFLSGEIPGKSIALISAKGKKWHAEQKILYALVRSEVTDAVVQISGTFRPCAGCYQSLKLVKDRFSPNLIFGERPGHFWNTTSDCFHAIVRLLVATGHLTKDAAETFVDNPNDPGTHQAWILGEGQALITQNIVSDSDSDLESSPED